MTEFEAKAAGQKCLTAGRRASPEVVFSMLTPLDVVSFISNEVEERFFTDNAGIGLPLGIERVIGVGAKYCSGNMLPNGEIDETIDTHTGWAIK